MAKFLRSHGFKCRGCRGSGQRKKSSEISDIKLFIDNELFRIECKMRAEKTLIGLYNSLAKEDKEILDKEDDGATSLCIALNQQSFIDLLSCKSIPSVKKTSQAPQWLIKESFKQDDADILAFISPYKKWMFVLRPHIYDCFINRF